MKTHHNPALHEEPRNQPISTTPPIPRESLFQWIESTSRFLPDQVDESPNQKVAEEIDDILDPEVYAPETEEEEEEL